MLVDVDASQSEPTANESTKHNHPSTTRSGRAEANTAEATSRASLQMFEMGP